MQETKLVPPEVHTFHDLNQYRCMHLSTGPDGSQTNKLKTHHCSCLKELVANNFFLELSERRPMRCDFIIIYGYICVRLGLVFQERAEPVDRKVYRKQGVRYKGYNDRMYTSRFNPLHQKACNNPNCRHQQDKYKPQKAIPVMQT